MKPLDKPRDLSDVPGPPSAEELSDTELEAVTAGGSKQPDNGGGSGGRGRNFRPPLLTGFSPNIR